MTVTTTGNVDHACGHCTEHDLSAKQASERAGYTRWLGTKDCTGCWQASRDAQAGREHDEWLAERQAAELAGIEASGRRLASASWWIDQRDAEASDVEELVTDAASSDAARTSENPY